MSERPDNPKLFQWARLGDVERGETDITLRDFFAAAALAGLRTNDPGDTTYEVDAQDAYRSADAMLQEREKRETQK